MTFWGPFLMAITVRAITTGLWVQVQHWLQQLSSPHEDKCHAQVSHLQVVGTFHVLTASSIFFLPPWKEKCLSKDAA